MPAFLRFTSLFTGPVASVTSSRCRPDCTACGAEEHSDSVSIVFVRRGAFVKHFGRERIVADANQVLFFRPGPSYRVGHLDTGGDDCTIIRLSESELRAVANGHPGESADGTALPERLKSAPTDPRTDLLHRGLYRALVEGRSGPRGAIGVEEVALELAARAVRSGLDVLGTRSRRASRGGTAEADRERVSSVKEFLVRSRGAAPSLAPLARAAHCSAFHLSRTFRRETGVTIRSYAAGLKLRGAIDMMLSGETDLTRVALSCGYFDHSHFTNAFTRAVGMPPAALRKCDRSDLRAWRRRLGN